MFLLLLPGGHANDRVVGWVDTERERERGEDIKIKEGKDLYVIFLFTLRFCFLFQL